MSHTITPLPSQQALSREVTRVLTKPGLQWAALLGPPGCGKTTVANLFARDWTAAPPNAAPSPSKDTIHWLDLTDTHRPDDAQGALALLTDGLTIAPDASPVLIVDGAEGCGEGLAPVLESWMGFHTGWKVLVTSRRTLAIPNGASILVPPLSPQESQTLFTAQARLASATWTVTAQQAPLFQTLLDNLDGLPQAIALAASRVRHLSLNQLIERHHPERGKTPLRRAAKDAWEGLDPGAQRLLAHMTVFRGTTTLEALEETACEALDGMDPDRVWEAASTLMDHSMVVRRGERLRLLRCIRAVADDHLDQTQRLRSWRAHAEHHLGLALDRLGVERLQLEMDNLLAIHERFHRTDPALIERLGDVLAPALMPGRAQPSVASMFDFSVRQMAAERRHERSRRLQERAERLISQGQPELARQDLQQALGLLEAHSPQKLRWSLQRALARVLARQGMTEQATTLYNEALQSAHQTGRASHVASTLGSLGRLQLRQHRHDAALQTFQNMRAVASEADAPDLLQRALINLGNAHRDAGRLHEAEGCFTEALMLAQDALDGAHLPLLHTNLGLIAMEASHPLDAAYHFERSLALGSPADHRLGALLHTHLAALALTDRKLKQANTHLPKAINAHKLARQPQGLARAYLLQGIAHLEASNPDQAAESFTQAQDHARQPRARLDHDARQHLTTLALMGVAASAHGNKAPLDTIKHTLATAARCAHSCRAPGLQALLRMAINHTTDANAEPPKLDALPQPIADWLTERAQNPSAPMPPVYPCVVSQHPGAILCAWLLHKGAAQTEVPSPGVPDTKGGYRFAPDASNFWTPEGQQVHLRRPLLQQLLKALLEARLNAPGQGLSRSQMLQAGWPDEKMSDASARSRLYVAIHTLRRSGLGDLLETHPDGYTLSAQIPVSTLQTSHTLPNSPDDGLKST